MTPKFLLCAYVTCMIIYGVIAVFLFVGIVLGLTGKVPSDMNDDTTTAIVSGIMLTFWILGGIILIIYLLYKKKWKRKEETYDVV